MLWIIRILLFWSVTLSPTFSYCQTTEKQGSNFLVITDIHLDTSLFHVMDFSPSHRNILNDLDTPSFDALIASIQQGIKKGTINKPKFIIILGDIVGHLVYFSKSRIQDEFYVFNTLKKTFPSIPIFYTFGNNDSLLADYGPFFDSKREGKIQSPYEVAKKKASWEDGFLSTGTKCKTAHPIYPCIITEEVIHGYYSAYLEPKLQLIALNSVMFSPHRVQVSELEAINQLLWLESELMKARQSKNSVILTMHIPPGANVYDNSQFWLPKETAIFLKLVNTFHDTIIGLLASHTHAEELKIVRNNGSKAISGVFLTAALSTYHGNAPSIKTFFFSSHHEHWQLNNYEAFYFLKQNTTLVLSKLYDYKSFYCNSEASSLFQCLTQVTADKMKRYFSAGNPNYLGQLNFPKDMIILSTSE